MELGTAGALESAATRTDEVAVLTTEPELLDSLRDAAPQLALMGAGSVGELARLLGSHPCRALAVDFATIGNGGLAIMERLAALFPEMPLVVIGTPGDEPFVTPLLDRAVVWRFLATPLAHESAAAVLTEAARVGRQRALGVEPADDEEDDLDDDGDEIRDEDPDAADEEEDDEDEPRPDAPASLRRSPDPRRIAPATPAPRQPPVRRWPTANRSAPDPRSRTPGAPASRDSTSGTGGIGGTGATGARARPPLRRPALPKAAWPAVGGAALLGVLAFALLTRDRTPTAPTASTAPTVLAAPTVADRAGDTRRTVERAPPGVATLVAAGDLALARGALVAPLGTSAIDYYRRAVALDPGDDAARTGLTAVADALLRDADAAFAGGRLAEAESAVRAAALADPDDPRVGALLARVRDAGTRGAGRGSPARTVGTPAVAAPPARSGAKEPRIASAAVVAAPASGIRSDASAAAPGGTAARGGTQAGRPSDAGLATRASAPSGPTAVDSSGAGPQAPAAAPGTPPDGSATARGATAPSGRGPDAPNVPLQRVSGAAPVFPQRARENGVEGWVDVEFTVDTRGVPGDIRVVDARPAGTFDRAVERAIAGWRYAPQTEPRSVRMRVRFEVAE